jgi:hypothetical protein
MKLGAFSISLSVKDLQKSKDFMKNWVLQRWQELWNKII